MSIISKYICDKCLFIKVVFVIVVKFRFYFVYEDSSYEAV